MKQVLLALFISMSFASISYAQGIRLNGYAAYVFDNSFDNYYSFDSYVNGKILGGLQWGIGIEKMVQPEMGIELLYYRQDTEAPINYWEGINVSRTLDLAINNIFLAGTRYMPVNDVFEGYAGLMAGVAIYDNKDPVPGEPNSVTKFAWGIRLGGNIWFSEKIGIKIQTQLLSAVQGFGGSFYFGTGGGGAGVSTYSTLWQFGLGGGIVIRVGS